MARGQRAGGGVESAIKVIACHSLSPSFSAMKTQRLAPSPCPSHKKSRWPKWLWFQFGKGNKYFWTFKDLSRDLHQLTWGPVVRVDDWGIEPALPLPQRSAQWFLVVRPSCHMYTHAPPSRGGLNLPLRSCYLPQHHPDIDIPLLTITHTQSASLSQFYATFFAHMRITIASHSHCLLEQNLLCYLRY